MSDLTLDDIKDVPEEDQKKILQDDWRKMFGRGGPEEVGDDQIITVALPSRGPIPEKRKQDLF